MHARRIEDALRSDCSDHIQKWSGPHIATCVCNVYANVSGATLKGRPLNWRPLHELRASYRSAKQQEASATGKMDSRALGQSLLCWVTRFKFRCELGMRNEEMMYLFYNILYILYNKTNDHRSMFLVILNCRELKLIQSHKELLNSSLFNMPLFIAYEPTNSVCCVFVVASPDRGCHLFRLSVCFKGGSALWITD